MMAHPKNPATKSAGFMPAFESIASLKPSNWNEAQFRVLYEGYKDRLDHDSLLRKLETMGYRASLIDIDSFVCQMDSLVVTDTPKLAMSIQHDLDEGLITKTSPKMTTSTAPRRKTKSKDYIDSRKFQLKGQGTRIPNPSNLYPSKRKVKPQSPSVDFGNYNQEQRLEELEEIFYNCITGVEESKKITKRQSQPASKVTTQSWIEGDFFYPNYDRPYFEHNEFRKITNGLSQILEHQPGKLKYSDFKGIQKSLGQMSLVSANFMSKQKEILQNYRQISRSFVKTRSNRLLQQLPDKSYQEYFQKLVSLNVGKPVLAKHPVCGHLHQGSVLAHFKKNQIMIKFCNPELGVRKVYDFQICSEYVYLYRKTTNVRTLDISIISNMDFVATSIQFKLLETKSNLLCQLRLLGKELERVKGLKQVMSEECKQAYGYICFIMSVIDRLLNVLFRGARLRCNYTKKEAMNTMTVGGSNFINIIGRELEIVDKKEEPPALPGIGLIKHEEFVDQIVDTVWKEKNFQQRFFKDEALVKAILGQLLCTRKFPQLLVNFSQAKYISTIVESLQKLKEDSSKVYEILIDVYSK